MICPKFAEKAGGWAQPASGHRQTKTQPNPLFGGVFDGGRGKD
jgi:hypothetical protein